MFEIQKFEDEAQQNGIRYWLAHDFMATLGYETWTSFKTVLQKAMGSCLQLRIDADEAFIPTELPDGQKSYRLTRFACFLVAMQADSKKPDVAKAQVSLAAIAEALVEAKISEFGMARIEERSKLTVAEKQLGGAAEKAGLQSGMEYVVFRDFGFRGMYNMPLRELQVRKGMPAGKTLYDFMGLTELAANTFRITQTIERMRNKRVSGLNQSKDTAETVGKEVRAVMMRSEGIAPENLALEGHIDNVKKQIKSANQKMKLLDSQPKARNKKLPPIS
jgi:DNA-damage-inducible protein D